MSRRPRSFRLFLLLSFFVATSGFSGCSCGSGASTDLPDSETPGDTSGATSGGSGGETDGGTGEDGGGTGTIEPVCGDGIKEAPEGCDDGNTDNTDACLDTCVSATCGDGGLQAGVEECDDGVGNDDALANACRTNCTNAHCGDGVIDTGEACEDGNLSDNDACPTTCQAAFCGDGFVLTGTEPCDDGNGVDGDACENDCTLPVCGNVIFDQGELCYTSTTPDIWDGTAGDPKTPGPLAVGDLTGDGIDDFATVVTFNFLDPSSISIFVGGAGGLSVERNYYSNKIPRGITVGDFTGDGMADMAIVNSYFNANPALDLDQVRVMPTVSYNSGTGAFNFSPVAVKETGEDPRAVAMGDVDNTNNKDVVVANSQGDTVSVFLKGSGSSFANGVVYAVGDDPRGVVIGDLNGDGSNDVVSSNVGGHTVSVLMNKDDGTGTFNAKVDYPVVDTVAYPGTETPFSLAIGDLDNDGDQDIVVIAAGTVDLVSVLRNDGTGILSLGSAPGESYATGDFPLAVSVGELNNDGFLDIAVACFDSNKVSLFLNDGNGGFLLKQDFNAGTNPAGIGIGDFNNDGIPDVAVTNQTSNDATVLFGNP